MTGATIRTIVAFLVMATIIGLAIWSWQWHRSHRGELQGAVRARWSRMRTRWSPHAYLTIHFLVGLGISLAALALFSLITIGVVQKQRVTLFDQQLVDWIHRHATRPGIQIAKFGAALGDPRLMLAILVIGSTLLWLRRKHIMLIGWIVAFVGATALDNGLKLIFRRDNPLWESPFFSAGGFSFPSGHVLGALVGWTMLAYFFAREDRSRKWSDETIGLITSGIVLSVAMGRIYLGVHFPSDVIAAFAAGMIWVATCVSAVEIAVGDRDRRKADRRAAERSDDGDRRQGDRRASESEESAAPALR
jgi:membrane-associated phospholipid phosphatase